jgi:hypothetical protein
LKGEREGEKERRRERQREGGHPEAAPAFAFPDPLYESRSLVCYSMVCASEDVSAVSLGREESYSKDGVAYKMAPAEIGRGCGHGSEGEGEEDWERGRGRQREKKRVGGRGRERER